MTDSTEKGSRAQAGGGRSLTWEAFCQEFLPEMLDEWGAPDLGRRIGEDVMARADSYAASGPAARRVLRVPFLEEVSGYAPVEAPRHHLAQVCLVVRCSTLETAHADGSVQDGGLVGITDLATPPLSVWLSTRESAADSGLVGVFSGLDDRWPRAWAALEALSTASRGGRASFRMADAPMPEMPDESERITARVNGAGHTVLSGIDPRFDDEAMGILEAATPGFTILISSLSRFSRDLDKMMRMLEIILSRGGSILTANHLIRPGEVFTRQGELVRPDSKNPARVLENRSGLSGVHGKIVVSVQRDLRA